MEKLVNLVKGKGMLPQLLNASKMGTEDYAAALHETVTNDDQLFLQELKQLGSEHPTCVSKPAEFDRLKAEATKLFSAGKYETAIAKYSGTLYAYLPGPFGSTLVITHVIQCQNPLQSNCTLNNINRVPPSRKRPRRCL